MWKPRILLFTFCALFLIQSQAQAQIDSAKLLNDIKIMSSADFEGRRPGSAGHQKALNFIVERFSSLGLQTFGDSYIHTFEVRDSLIGQNLIGYIPGKSSDKAIVFSGHYDHIGIRNGQINYGADDNASGAVALLALAEYFAAHPPEHTMIFVSFDAEEMGLRGARAFVANPPVPLDKVLLNINMDMVSRNDENRLVASGTHHHPHLIPFVDGVQNEMITLVRGYDVPGTGRNDWTMQSDQGAFFRAGVPFIYFGVEDHPDYHTPNDTFENIQPRFFYQAVRSILDFSKAVDSAK